MAFDTPQSTNEAILQNMLGASNALKPPQSRVEKLLQELSGQMPEANPSEGTTTGTLERLKIGDDIYSVKGGGSGTSDYDALNNKPQIAGTTLSGNKSLADLGIASASAVSDILNGTDIDSFGDVETALAGKADLTDLAPAFSTETAYAVGKYVSYGGNIYKCTSAHSAGAWAAGDFTIVAVGSELESKQDTLTFDDVPTANSNNPVKSGGVKSAIDAAVASAYHHAGTKTCAELVAGLLVAGNEGNVYNMTDSGTTTADFIEGAGQPIKAGDNVGVCKVSDGVYKFDLLSGFVDTSNFVQKSETAGLLKNDGTVNDEIEGDVSTLKSGLTNLDTEVNGDAVEYPYADVITIEDAVPANLADCKVKLEPVQDLHGQSAPYVGGAGKNKWNGKYIKSDFTESDTYVAGTYDLGGNNAMSITAGLQYVASIDGEAVTIRYSFLDANKDRITTLTNGNVTTVAPNDAVYLQWRTYDEITENAKLQIEEGSTPTSFAPYTNYCPITGHTEASVQRDGRNLIGEFENGGFDSNGLNGLSDKRVRSKYYVSVQEGQTYTFNANMNGGSGNAVASISLYTTDDYTTPRVDAVSFANCPVTFTVPNGIKYVRVLLKNSSDGNVTVSSFKDFQLELGSTATPYVPYAGQTYTIALGDTIYGGTVRIDSNGNTVMDVDRVLKEYDGSNDEEWIYYDQRNCYSIPRPSDSGRDLYAETNQFKHGALYSTTTGEFYFGNDNLNINSVPMFATLSDWITHLSNNPLQLCYELATPFTVQLTPTQIQLLKGTNTLTASTGQISVTVNGVSGAIGSLTADKQDKTDYALETTAKTVVGGINELKNRVKVIEVTTSDTVDQGTTVKVPSGYDAAKAVIVGYTAQRTNNIWYNTDDHVAVGMYADYLYVVPKNADVLERTVKVILIKFSA